MKAKRNKNTANLRAQKLRDSLPILQAQFLHAYRQSLLAAARIEQLRAAEERGQYGKAAGE